MSRLGSRGITVIALSLLTISLGCGGGSTISTTTTTVVTPTIILLTPANNASLDIGDVVGFSATPEDSSGRPITPSPLVTFVSNNPNVLQIAANGLACAGKWDSLVNPEVCTAGPVGTANVTAESNGVSSPPTTVYVHQHIDSIIITPATTLTTPFPSCLSKGLTFDFQPTVMSQGQDITASVGPVNWTSLNTVVAITSTSTTQKNLAVGNVRVTAATPGMTSFFASVANVNSPPFPFTTCPVKSISLAVGNSTATTFSVQSGSQSITATVKDSTGTQITNVNLSWNSSDASVFSATGAIIGAAASARPGTAAIIASCTPPTCNIGFPSPLAIYPENVITAIGTGTPGTAVNTTVWVASSECGVRDPVTQVVKNDDNCVSTIFPIDTINNNQEAGVDLPALPNSILFDRQSVKAYIGTDSGRLGTVGLAQITPASTTGVAPTLVSVPTAPGKVIAVSPNGLEVVVSDTADTPNQVFIVDAPVSGTPTSTALAITGATAATFAPDNSKVFIVAGSNLYIWSSDQALKTLSFTAPMNDVAFLPDGAFGYLAGGGNNGKQLTVLKTCDNQPALDDDGNSANITSLQFDPLFLKMTPDNKKVLAFNNVGMDFIDVTTMGKASNNVTATADGCSPPDFTQVPQLKGGLPTVVNLPESTSFNFGQGVLQPTQFIVNSDTTRAYILASNLNNILVFNIDSQTTSSIQLSGNAIPVRASLTSDGGTLWVIGHDPVTDVNTIHLIDTGRNLDRNQITLTQSLCHARFATAGPFTCDVDLIAVKP